ncbi:MAG: A/G-specific adenine glycosylase [Chitinophagaceae bacterium]
MNPGFTPKLLQWNAHQNSRDMPWKGEKDPYKIWLSEIMLQQTRVEQGWKYYENFITEFPTIHDLAAASDEKVFKMWEGLGYYTRCKNLLATARTISLEYNGKFPDNYEAIKKLKGIGPYTAAAIASFAFNEAQAVVDGNVQRVLSRYFGISTPIDTTAGKKLYQELAQALLDKSQPGLYNQAIMDFGAVICKPQNPLCAECIQQEECEAFKHNMVKQLPVKEKTLQKKERWLYYFLVQVGDKIYIRKRTGKDIWENLHEFVLFESPAALQESFDQLPFLKELFKKQSFRIISISKTFNQQLTHQTIHGRFVTIQVAKPLPTLEHYLLIPRSELSEYAFPRFINMYLEDSAGQAQLF